MDETGVSLDHSPPKVLCSVKDRAEMVTHGKSPNTTLLSCVNAAEDALPPYLVVKGKTIPNEMKNGAMPGTVFTASETCSNFGTTPPTNQWSATIYLLSQQPHTHSSHFIASNKHLNLDQHDLSG